MVFRSLYLTISAFFITHQLQLLVITAAYGCADLRLNLTLSSNKPISELYVDGTQSPNATWTPTTQVQIPASADLVAISGVNIDRSLSTFTLSASTDDSRLSAYQISFTCSSTATVGGSWMLKDFNDSSWKAISNARYVGSSVGSVHVNVGRAVSSDKKDKTSWNFRRRTWSSENSKYDTKRALFTSTIRATAFWIWSGEPIGQKVYCRAHLTHTCS